MGKEHDEVVESTMTIGFCHQCSEREIRRHGEPDGVRLDFRFFLFPACPSEMPYAHLARCLLSTYSCTYHAIASFFVLVSIVRTGVDCPVLIFVSILR